MCKLIYQLHAHGQALDWIGCHTTSGYTHLPTLTSAVRTLPTASTSSWQCSCTIWGRSCRITSPRGSAANPGQQELEATIGLRGVASRCGRRAVCDPRCMSAGARLGHGAAGERAAGGGLQLVLGDRRRLSGTRERRSLGVNPLLVSGRERGVFAGRNISVDARYFPFSDVLPCPSTDSLKTSFM